MSEAMASKPRPVFCRMEARLARALEILRSRDAGLPPDLGRMDRRNARLAERDYEERVRRARLTVDGEVFAGLRLSRRDWRWLEDAGLLQIKSEVETFYPDRDSGRPAERRVNLVSLTDAGRSTIGYEGAPHESKRF